MNNEEVKKWIKARPTIDSCIDDAVRELLRLDPHKDYVIRQKYYRRICYLLAEESIDAYLGDLELDVEELC